MIWNALLSLIYADTLPLCAASGSAGRACVRSPVGKGRARRAYDGHELGWPLPCFCVLVARGDISRETVGENCATRFDASKL